MGKFSRFRLHMHAITLRHVFYVKISMLCIIYMGFSAFLYWYLYIIYNIDYFYTVSILYFRKPTRTRPGLPHTALIEE